MPVGFGYCTIRVSCVDVVVLPDVAVTVIMDVPVGVDAVGGGGAGELEPPPQPTRRVAAVMGIRIRQAESATRTMRRRDGGF